MRFKPAEKIDHTDFSLEMKIRIWTEKTASCWQWAGGTQGTGYGIFKFKGETYLAHRTAWAFANKQDPGGMFVDHMCHNTSCINPEHLRLATNKQNLEHVRAARASSGFRGVHVQPNGRFRVVVRHNYKAHSGGYFGTAEEANAAAIELRNKLFTHNLLDRAPA